MSDAEMAQWIVLIFGLGAVLYQGYILLKGSGLPKIRCFRKHTPNSELHCFWLFHHTINNNMTIKVVDDIVAGRWTLFTPLNHHFSWGCPSPSVIPSL